MPPRKNKARYVDFFSTDSIKHYRHDVCGFVEDIIFHNDSKAKGGKYFLSDQQKEILLNIQKYKRISVKSGRGIGKTAAIAFACIWWLCVHPNNCKFVCTAPSYKTLKTGLWNEIEMWFNQSVVSSIFEIGAERIYLRENKAGCFAEPRTAREKESMSGIHADHLLIICDEASGTADEILRGLDATITSGPDNKLCLITNPTQTSGFFYDTHNVDRKRWHRLTYSSEFSPFVDQEHVESYKTKWGITHPLYLVDVLGQFPPQNAESFLSMYEIKQAMARTIVPKGDIELGVDVARYGDDSTIIYWRHGNKIYEAKKMEKSSVVDVVNLVKQTVTVIREKTKTIHRINVKVDDTGVGGGVTDILMLDRDLNINVIPCNFGGKGNDIYQNEASIMWGTIKDNLSEMELPDDRVLMEELASRRWKLSSSGKIMIEPKSDYKKQFGSSPDRADALCLCMAQKGDVRTVLKEFDPIDPDVIIDRLNYLPEVRYCSVWTTKDLNFSIVYVAWDGMKATIYDEYFGADPIMHMSFNIHSHQPLQKIIGNENMFARSGDSIAVKLRKYKINIRSNYGFNELGAIEALNDFVSTKKIKISSKCVNVIEQMSKWKMEGSKLMLETDYGLCYALSNVMSMLKKTQNYRVKPFAFLPYSNQKTDFLNKPDGAKKNKWMYM